MILNDYESSIMNTYMQGEEINILINYDIQSFSKDPNELLNHMKQLIRAMKSLKLDIKINKTQ
jgi:hypothetical protein